MHIYIVNGAPGSGKTTFENFIMDICKDDVYILSTVDCVKAAAQLLGWDGSKTPKNRKFLSDLKDLWTEWDDGSVKYIKKRIENIKKSYEVYDMTDDQAVVFIDSREPEEIERLKRELDAKTILIKREAGADDKEILNHADRDIELYDYELTIENNDSLEDFRKTAEAFTVVEGIKNTQEN